MLWTCGHGEVPEGCRKAVIVRLNRGRGSRDDKLLLGNKTIHYDKETIWKSFELEDEDI